MPPDKFRVMNESEVNDNNKKKTNQLTELARRGMAGDIHHESGRHQDGLENSKSSRCGTTEISFHQWQREIELVRVSFGESRDNSSARTPTHVAFTTSPWDTKHFQKSSLPCQLSLVRFRRPYPQEQKVGYSQNKPTCHTAIFKYVR